jgi:hypothetical protein
VFKGVLSNSKDPDSTGKQKIYAIKRIFPTINAAFVIIEIQILKYLK